MLPAEIHHVCLGLGSNADAVRNVRRGIRGLSRIAAVDAISTAWESPAVGVAGPNYVNAAVLVRTRRSKDWLTTAVKDVEGTLGRTRNTRQSPRVVIDIDILIFDRQIVEHDLWSQAYRALPLAELVPELVCPLTGEPITQAAARLASSSPIWRRPEVFRPIPTVEQLVDHPEPFDSDGTP